MVVAVGCSPEGDMGSSLDVLGTGMVAAAASGAGAPAVVVAVVTETVAAGAVVGLAFGVAGMAVTGTATGCAAVGVAAAGLIATGIKAETETLRLQLLLLLGRQLVLQIGLQPDGL